MNIGNNSSLPASILKVRASFDRGEKNAKFDVGPTPSRPGPTLFIVAVTAVKLVVKLCPSKETMNNTVAKSNT